MYEALIRDLPQEFNKEQLKKDYWDRLYACLKECSIHVENGNTDGALMLIGTVRELAEAINAIEINLTNNI